MIVVSDASPFNVLVRIGHVDVLPALFGSVIIPPAVAFELSHPSTPDVVRNWIRERQDWLTIQAPSSIDAALQIDDVGEAEAISLALELKADLLLADDRKARRIARERGLGITGAVGVLELASARNLLKLRGFRPNPPNGFPSGGANPPRGPHTRRDAPDAGMKLDILGTKRPDPRDRAARRHRS